MKARARPRLDQQPGADGAALEPLDRASLDLGGELGFDPSEPLVAGEEAVQEVAEQTPYGAVLLDDLMRRQLMLGLSVSAVFLLLLFVLPLLNRLAPRFVAVQFFGLPLSWLALAVLVYPFLWVLGAYFVTTAKKFEDDFTDLVRK